jgi:NADH dehydrogenase
MPVRSSRPRCTRLAFCARLAACALAGLVHCREQPGAELLQVDAVLPAEAQFGDSVQIIGDGFGLGSPATVTFRGDVYRAGRAPERIEFSFRAQTETQRELSLTLPRDAERVFCGGPEQASHATFRGEVEVAIAARALGAPPATGRLHGVVVELYPAVKTRASEDRSNALGQEVLAFLGVELGVARAGGLEVLRVAPGSRASAADLRPGDRLLNASGVTLLSPSDLVPDASRALALGVERGSVDALLRVDVDGFTPRPPAALDGAALLISTAALWFLGALSPLSRLFGWVGQNWLEQARARRRALRRVSPSGARAPEWPGGLELAGGFSGLLVWVGVAAALSAPLLRRAPVDVTRGLLVTLFASALLLVAFAFAAGQPGRARWSLGGALLAAAQQWLSALPGALALLATGFESGIELDDVVHAQGPWPWQWNAFQSPGYFLACAALLLGAVPRPGKPVWQLAHARPPRRSWRGDGDGWFDRLYLCSTCALAAALFLGGDALPAALSSPGWLGATLTAAVLLTKYTLLVLAVAFVRGLCLNISAAEWSRFALSVCLPVSLVAVAASKAWRVLCGVSPFWGWLAQGFGAASVAALLVGAALLAVRARAAAREPGPASLSPWL